MMNCMMIAIYSSLVLANVKVLANMSISLAYNLGSIAKLLKGLMEILLIFCGKDLNVKSVRNNIQSIYYMAQRNTVFWILNCPKALICS